MLVEFWGALQHIAEFNVFLNYLMREPEDLDETVENVVLECMKFGECRRHRFNVKSELTLRKDVERIFDRMQKTKADLWKGRVDAYNAKHPMGMWLVTPGVSSASGSDDNLNEKVRPSSPKLPTSARTTLGS
jgi:hypothetical protein